MTTRGCVSGMLSESFLVNSFYARPLLPHTIENGDDNDKELVTKNKFKNYVDEEGFCMRKRH